MDNHDSYYIQLIKVSEKIGKNQITIALEYVQLMPQINKLLKIKLSFFRKFSSVALDVNQLIHICSANILLHRSF